MRQGEDIDEIFYFILLFTMEEAWRKIEQIPFYQNIEKLID